MSSPPLRHVWPSGTAIGSWENLVWLSTSQPVHEESPPPLKYSCNGFAELWFTALEGLGCSLATFYPIIRLLGRSSVRKQEPTVWSQLWWGVLVSVAALPTQGSCEHSWPCNMSHCKRSSQSEAVLRCWGAAHVPSVIPWQCPHADKTEGKDQGNSRDWTTNAPWTYSQQPDGFNALCFIHMVPTGSFKEQAGKGQCSFLSLYVEFLSSRAVEKNSVFTVTVPSCAVLWVQTWHTEGTVCLGHETQK